MKTNLTKDEQDKLNELQSIYEYCRMRLPIMDGFSIEVSEFGTYTSNKSFYPINGVCLSLLKGKEVICKCCGVDADDVLLDVYRTLLNYYKTQTGSFKFKNPIVKPALSKTHFSY